MTEEEAKTKACPLLFMGNLAMMMAQDTEKERVNSSCVGSTCMMWRWREDGKMEELPNDKGWSTGGYCGLAGKP